MLGFAAITYVLQTSAGAASDLGPRVSGDVPLSLRIVNAIVVAALYVRKLVWPGDLAVFYPHPNLPGGEPWSAGAVAGACLVLGVITFGVLRLGATRGYAVLGWFGFLVSLVPVLGLIQTGEQGMADRFTYVPMMGLCLVVAFAAKEGLESTIASPRTRMAVGSLAAALVLGGFAWKSHLEAQHWRDTDALYQRALEVAPPNPMIRTYYANWLRRNDRPDEALAHHREVAKVPGYEAVGHFNAALLLESRGERDASFRHYRAALREAPDYVPARLAVARALEQRGDSRAAARHYAAAKAQAPESPVPLIGLARCLANAPDASPNERAHAVKFATRAVRMTGKRSADALDVLALALRSAGYADRAEGASRDARAVRAARSRGEVALAVSQGAPRSNAATAPPGFAGDSTEAAAVVSSPPADSR